MQRDDATQSTRRIYPSGSIRSAVLATATFLVMAAVISPMTAVAQRLSSDLSVGVSLGETYTLLDEQPSAQMNNAGALVNLPQARAKYPTVTGSGYTVAILDTGVDYTHPALSGRYRGGYDFVNNDSNPDDDFGHGTHVAGIAASNDSTYTGIAPQAGYAAVKVLDSTGSGNWSTIESGLQWVIDNRVALNIVSINMSFGTSNTYNFPETSQLSGELSALKNAGVFISAASGNGWFSHQPNQGVAYPAADPSAVAVGDVWSANFGGIAWGSGSKDYTTAADRVVSHCDRSTSMLSVFAPGAIITSAAYNWEGDNPDFVAMGGTSMAAPEVAGLALLIRQAIEQTWAPENWPTGAGWQDTILQVMQDTGALIYDGDDEDDNVTNLKAYFKRIDVLAALNAVYVPEPGSLTLLACGIAMLAAYVRLRKRG